MISHTVLRLLEFDKLLAILASSCHSEASEKEVLAIVPLQGRDDIGKRFGQITDIRTLSQEGTPLQIAPFTDISGLLSQVKPEGAVLEARELSAFSSLFRIASDIAERVRHRDDLSDLRALTGGLTGFPRILRILERSIDPEGNILDSASSELSSIRQRIRLLQGRIRKRLEELTRDETVSPFLQDTFITQRSGRWVIPVRMDAKGQVAGVVHDVSRTGETAFLEPIVIISLSNELENLVAEQKAEELRILRDISSQIRAAADEISAEFATVVHLDVLNCIALFSDRLGMQIPRIVGSGSIHLVSARHPLLMLAYEKSGDGRPVVPLDVHLGDDRSVMVVTGSNAGGKTVAIKTIGLLLLMALSGMPVSADSSSRFPLVRQVLVDIGDEQSIETSLSTFSAHVSNIADILKHADAESLVLVDELGTGTDPEEGAALACAVLKEIRQSGALLFATTHLTDIKAFVHRTEGMSNASMEFDRKTLTPLYRLRIGESGQSHALEIAQKYGLPEHVVSSAKQFLGTQKMEFDTLLADLAEKRTEYERLVEELERERRELETRERDIEQRMHEAERSRREVLAKAHGEALELITATKRDMNRFLDELKRSGRARNRELSKQIGEKQREVETGIREYNADAHVHPSIDQIREGDVVFVRSLGYDAPVTEILVRQGRLRVEAGAKEIEVPLSDIGIKREKPLHERGLARSPRQEEPVPLKINLVGMRVDEALSHLEPFLNHASLAGLSEVTVIHGYGTGVLSRAVREHLTGHPLVKAFRKGERHEGADGVTVVTLS